MESYVPEILLVIIGVITSRITSRFPSLEKEYKDLVALAVSIAVTYGFWVAHIVDVDVVARYNDVPSTWATVLVSGLIAWIVAMGWHLGEKWRRDTGYNADEGGLDQDTDTTIDDAWVD